MILRYVDGAVVLASIGVAMASSSCGAPQWRSGEPIGGHPGGEPRSSAVEPRAGLDRQVCDASEDGSSIGVLLDEGRGGGVGKDEGNALALFNQECNAGRIEGCSDLGAMYASGKGVTKDEGKAVALFQVAC